MSGSTPGPRATLFGGVPRWAAVAALLAFALVLQGTRPLFDPDEGRYTAVALQMLKSGDWLTPRLHHEVPHFSKPPLTYWSLAASMSLLGRNEWAVRLPNALAFVATVLLVFAIARRLAPDSPELAAVIQATSLLPFAAANVVTTDTLLALFETLAVAGFVLLRWGGAPPERARWLLWGGFGLAFLTKGPPGLLPLVAILVFAVWTDGARALARLVSWRSIALFLALAFAWYGWQLSQRPDLLGYLLGAEVVGRVASGEFDRNATLGGLIEIYLPVLVIGPLPWWPLLARRRGAAPPGSRAGLLAALRAAPERHFLLLWVLLPFAVFCVSRSRLPLYLLPLAPPVSLLLARALEPRLAFGRRGRVLLFAWLIALVGIKAAAARLETDRNGRHVAQEILRQVPYAPSEVVFAEHRPYFTLAFYLGVEAEQVDLATTERFRAAPSYRPTSAALAKEISEPQQRRVFLVPRSLEKTWSAELAGLGAESERAGEVGRFALYLEPHRRDTAPAVP
jgi:4-amino-4-deoxy-L-arabinose transferase